MCLEEVSARLVTGQTEFARAYGLADRANEIPNTVRTRFAIASGTKGLTALAVVSLVSLVSDGALAITATADMSCSR